MIQLRLTALKSIVGKWRDKIAIQHVLPEICDELASLLDAGLTLDVAVQHIAKRPRRGRIQRFLRQSAANLELGNRLSDTWRAHVPCILDMMLAAGEESGMVALALVRWSTHAREIQEARRAAVKTASYPLLLLVMTVALVGFSGHVLLPMFGDMYRQLGMRAPNSVRSVRTVLNLLPSVMAGVLGSLGLCAGILALIRYWMPRQWRRISPKLPGARMRVLWFTHMFVLLVYLLIAAGIPVTDALLLLAARSGSPLLRDICRDIAGRILAGQSLSTAFAGDWDPLLPVLLAWAEQTGDLQAALQRVQAYTANLFRQRLQVLCKLLEPILLVVMGVVVAMSMYVVFMPMYDAISSISSGGPMVGS